MPLQTMEKLHYLSKIRLSPWKCTSFFHFFFFFLLLEYLPTVIHKISETNSSFHVK